MKNIIIILTLLFWPLSLFMANTREDFVKNIIPLGFLIVSYFLFKKESRFYLLPSLGIPFFEAKLTLLPLTLTLCHLLFYNLKDLKLKKKPFLEVFLLIMSAIILFLNWKAFKGQTIFNHDYEAEQIVLDKINLYPSVFYARVFQNKPRIYLNKLSDNLFALTDPNNYFFGFHPRQIVIDNQNLKKFPFVSLLFFSFGVYFLKHFSRWRFIVLCLAASLISLSVLKAFDRVDIILWLSISLIIVHGINMISQKKRFRVVIYFLFLLFTIPQLIRILLGYS